MLYLMRSGNDSNLDMRLSKNDYDSHLYRKPCLFYIKVSKQNVGLGWEVNDFYLGKLMLKFLRDIQVWTSWSLCREETVPYQITVG